MIMLVRSCTSDEAFTVLREVSQRTNVKVHDVAAVIVAAGCHAEQPGELASLDQETITAVLNEAHRDGLGATLT